MENTFELGTMKFKLSKINAFKQFHIVRKIGPILAELGPAMAAIEKSSKNKGLSSEDQLSEFAKIASPIMIGLAKLSDSDSEYVLFSLLNSVEIHQGVGWAKVAVENNLMMNQLELPQLLQLAGKAFAFNLSGFFAALPGK